ncbi:MAG: NAD(P)-dependent oxidoreductase [Propionibacteriaceae bacterium]
MTIAIIGASGNLGSRLALQAAQAGHQVTAYARRIDAVPHHSNITPVHGAVEDTAALADALRGVDTGVISITGKISDASFMQDRLPGIIDAATQAELHRLVLVSTFGAGPTLAKASWFARCIYRTALRKFLADKASADRLLQESSIPWTIVYPVNLDPKTSAHIALVKTLDDVAQVPGLPTLSMDAAATALRDIATDPTRINQQLIVTTAKGWKPAV